MLTEKTREFKKELELLCKRHKIELSCFESVDETSYGDVCNGQEIIYGPEATCSARQYSEMKNTFTRMRIELISDERTYTDKPTRTEFGEWEKNNG